MQRSGVHRPIVRLAKRAQAICSEQGIARVVSRGVDKLSVYAAAPYYKSTKAKQNFKYQNQYYNYFINSYNATWRNERAVEIALAQHFLNSLAPGRILELGNVMNYYTANTHIVVDKYEHSPGINNVDILEFESADKFDAIVSISTLEHIGWDETPKDANKTLRTIEKLKSLLKPGGRMFISFPIGHNEYLDKHLFDGKIALPNLGFMKRLNINNDWCEVELADVKGVTYGKPYPAANALCIAVA